MPKKPLPAAATGLPTSETETCPVAALAREAAIISERENQLDVASLSLTGGAKCENKHLNERLYDRRHLLEEQASHMLAQSGLGALYQVALIHDAAHDLFDNMECKGLELWRARQAFNRIDHMAYSLLAFIEAATGAKSEDFGVENCMPAASNPHLQLAKAIDGEREG